MKGKSETPPTTRQSCVISNGPTNSTNSSVTKTNLRMRCCCPYRYSLPPSSHLVLGLRGRNEKRIHFFGGETVHRLSLMVHHGLVTSTARTRVPYNRRGTILDCGCGECAEVDNWTLKLYDVVQ